MATAQLISPTAANAAMAIAARPAAALPAAATPSATGSPMTEEARQQGVYARSGSAIAASQAKMGENSYYYSVGKNKAAPSGTVVKAVPQAPAPAPAGSAPSQPMPQAVAARPATLPEQTLSSFSYVDDEGVVKVHINLAGAGALPDGAIRCIFRERSFDLKVTVASEHKLYRLHIPLLGELIDPEKCVVRRKAGKLIVVLTKQETGKGWFELRKTKGVGDSEYNSLVPDSGADVEFSI